MDKWDKSQRDYQQRYYRENPSFSSTLLDSIYRSIEEGETEEKENQLAFYKETMKKQKQSSFFFDDDDEDEAKAPIFLRSQKVENWMDKRGCEKSVIRRNSIHSTSTSSDSSSNGGFSSSDSSSELFNGVPRPKPIRTSVVPSQKSSFDSLQGYKNHPSQTQKPRHENGIEQKTKSKALRRIVYGDMKKAKQPISPGARLASFLSSLLNAKKKPKVVSSKPVTQPPPASTCSSASSFSRSCLSKTPSSSRSGAKSNRSVTFCPVSVIVGEDCRPCGHKNLHEGEKSYGCKKSNIEELRFHVMQESRRVEEFARGLLKNYQTKREEDKIKNFETMHYEEEEEDDDGASCSSSDLFELDNLSSIGNIERYREELPVYETTHFNTNRAITNGFML